MCSDKSVQRNAIKHSSAFASAEMHWDALSTRVVQFEHKIVTAVDKLLLLLRITNDSYNIVLNAIVRTPGECEK